MLKENHYLIVSLKNNFTLNLTSSVFFDGNCTTFVDPKIPAKAIYGFGVVVLEIPVARALVGTIIT
jgi:hypothetical protein